RRRRGVGGVRVGGADEGVAPHPAVVVEVDGDPGNLTAVGGHEADAVADVRPPGRAAPLPPEPDPHAVVEALDVEAGEVRHPPGPVHGIRSVTVELHARADLHLARVRPAPEAGLTRADADIPGCEVEA